MKVAETGRGCEQKDRLDKARPAVMTVAPDELKLNHRVDVMRFTLVYDGPAQTRHNAQTDYKQKLRREFHQQLLDLWQSKPALERYYTEFLRLSPEERAATGKTSDDGSELIYRGQVKHGPRRDSIIMQLSRGKFNFIPLVSSKLWLTAELDILFLRAEPAGSLFTTNFAGDLDNRLKVLFDALRLPQEDQEMPATDEPQNGEDPFFCLLENDNLITAVRLESERLYGPADQRNRVRLVIKVTVKAQQFAWGTIDIVND